MKKKTNNLGTFNESLLIFGGVYSNLQALSQLKVEALRLNIPPSRIICTGDIIAYCAQPVECLDFIRSWGIHLINGNVEINLLNESDDCGCNFSEGSRCDVLSKRWYPYAQAALSDSDRTFIERIPDHITFQWNGHKCFVLHGGYHNVSEFIFKSTDWSIKKAILDELKADIVFAGHCGLPFHQSKNNKYWINAGVIGMPANDGNTNTWYSVLDYKNNKIEISYHPLKYDHVTAAKLMDKNNLPKAYSKTLLTGIWDNCDILPAVESRQQGNTLLF